MKTRRKYMSKGTIIKVSGPLVVAENMKHANMFDVVRVSNERLIGEIIEMRDDKASIQVYEETAGLGPGEPVESTGAPLSVELAPGLIENMFDGIQRPLEEIRKKSGNSISRGVEVDSLDREKKWDFKPVLEKGEVVKAGTL
jgi:V/A-type H+-transporting ATPase subunit A